MWKKYLSLLVIVFGVLGYFVSWVLQEAGLSPDSQFTEGVLIFKDLFFASLKMLVAPIVFFSLLQGLIQISEISHLGKMGRYTLTYYFSTTVVAILIGLSVVFFIHPWENSEPAVKSHTSAQQKAEQTTAQISPAQELIQKPQHQLLEKKAAPKKVVDAKDATTMAVARNMVKRVFVNPVDALVSNNILSIVLWAFLIGIAFIKLGGVDAGIKAFITEANRVLNMILGWVILWAPIGVFAIAFDFQQSFSGALIGQMLGFMLVVFGATAVHGLIVLPTIIKFVSGVSLREFLTKASKALVLALTTSSSSATLPVSMKVAEEEFGVPNKVSSFVLPLGATMNMDGTALFEGIAAVFLAYIFGIELSAVAMLSIFFLSIISSVGAPGMPSGSMSGMQMVLIAAGIPLEGIGILMVIERPLDTFRTAVNVEGDIGGALVVNALLEKDASLAVSNG